MQLANLATNSHSPQGHQIILHAPALHSIYSWCSTYNNTSPQRLFKNVRLVVVVVVTSGRWNAWSEPPLQLTHTYTHIHRDTHSPDRVHFMYIIYIHTYTQANDDSTHWLVFSFIFIPQHRIQFDDTATRTFEYPSEASMLLEAEATSSLDGETSASGDAAAGAAAARSAGPSGTLPSLLGEKYYYYYYYYYLLCGCYMPRVAAAAAATCMGHYYFKTSLSRARERERHHGFFWCGYIYREELALRAREVNVAHRARRFDFYGAVARREDENEEFFLGSPSRGTDFEWLPRDRFFSLFMNRRTVVFCNRLFQLLLVNEPFDYTADRNYSEYSERRDYIPLAF